MNSREKHIYLAFHPKNLYCISGPSFSQVTVSSETQYPSPNCSYMIRHWLKFSIVNQRQNLQSPRSGQVILHDSNSPQLLSASPKIQIIRLQVSPPLMAICIINVEFRSVSITSLKSDIYFKGVPGCDEEIGEKQKQNNEEMTENESRAIMGNSQFIKLPEKARYLGFLRSRLREDFPIDSRCREKSAYGDDKLGISH